MKINIGKFTRNKTWYYLMPCLKGHGGPLIKKLGSVYKLGCGIHDELLEGSAITEEPLVYILTDKLCKPAVWKSFLNWVRFEPYFITDYAMRGDLTQRKHMIVLRIPEQYDGAYDAFLRGHYSKMYTPEQLQQLYQPNSREQPFYKILSKNPVAIGSFKELVMDTYGVDVMPENITEYDIPLLRSEEVFNVGASHTKRTHHITSKQDIL